MARRSKPQQSKHDKKVQQIVGRLERDGWSVEADLPGRDNRPDPIGQGGYIPDIVATKAGARRIVEVETSESLSKDRKQQEAFRRSASQQNRTSFTIEEA